MDANAVFSHVALDEILPHALRVLGLVWVVLTAAYVRFRTVAGTARST